MTNDRERQTHLLGEVKFAERQLEKARLLIPALEAKARQALVAGQRELALKYALQIEEKKQAVALGETKVVVCKQALAKAKERNHELKGALARRDLAQGLGQIAEIALKSEAADDMFEKIERETAINEAKAEMALEAAGEGLEPALSPLSDAEAILAELEGSLGGAPAAEPEPPQTSAEEILKEFEGGI
ncbi:MAG: hypothetical protein JKY65_15425 [Planctomycetes bacterium]|nr:hypothetical protein [Planctomycetota bacterium]